MRIETELKKQARIKKAQQAAFRRFVRGEATPVKIREYIGLNWQETKIYVESQMLRSMSWSNYGSYWVIDHIVPFWVFNLKKESDLKLLWNPENLMPMRWRDNNRKQGNLRFALDFLRRRADNSPYSLVRERLIELCMKEEKPMDDYFYGEKEI